MQVLQPSQQGLIRQDDFRQKVAPACALQKTLQLKELLGVKPREHAALSMHPAKLFDSRTNNAKAITFELPVMEQAEAPLGAR